jgi:hypothetical protein
MKVLEKTSPKIPAWRISPNPMVEYPNGNPSNAFQRKLKIPNMKYIQIDLVTMFN